MTIWIRPFLCTVPALTGLTLAQAEARASRAGCTLGIGGASALVKPDVQTVQRQAPAPSRRSAAVTIWVNRFLCSVPNLTGLTVAEAEARAAQASCQLHIEGAPLKEAGIQTVERQSPEAAQLSEGVTVSINPFCTGSSAPGPGPVEGLSPGPTELVSGFYIAGGPLYRYSTPECSRPIPAPGAGTVEVMNGLGELVASATSTSGHFVEIPLPAGHYRLRATFLNASINGQNPTETRTVEIPEGETVREDFVLDVP